MTVSVVTGANAGIGFATAKGLAEAGHHVVMVCRNAERGADALAAVSALGSAELVLCDLGKPDSVREAATAIATKHARLDVLINNAGAYTPERRVTEEGYELTFAVNHLGAFRFTRHLLPLLKVSAPSRVIVLSSRSHREGRLDLTDPHREHRPYHGYAAYSDSKLCNLLFVRELARRLHRTGVTVNAVHPGVVGTEFAQDQPGWLQRLFLVARPFMLSPASGADTVVFLATDPVGAEVSGGYWVKRAQRLPNLDAVDVVLAAKLWDLSEELAGPLPPV